MRKRLTNDNPTSNTETMLNLAYAKDGNVYLRYGVDDINLCDYVSDLATNKGCNYTSNEIMEGACLECDCCVNLLYCLAVQAAELRERLKHYEDLEEQGQLIVPPCKVREDVWCIVEDIKEVMCGKVRRFTVGEDYINVYVGIDGYFEQVYNAKEFGVKIFRCKEEAEKALEMIKCQNKK